MLIDSLTPILEELLREDITITFREVARRHPSLSSATSLTRNQERRAIVERYIANQANLRNWRERTSKRSKANLALSLQARDARIAELERDLEILRASHVAMIRVVGELGGFKRWSEFFPRYQAILESVGALSDKENVSSITSAAKSAENKAAD